MTRAVLSAETELEIPFQDVDPMQVAWHGHYFRYFEAARSQMLRKIDFDYEEMRATDYLWPIIKTEVKFVQAIRYGQRVLVRATLAEWENRLKIDYLIHDLASGARLTKGYTVQCAVHAATGELQLVSPPVLLRAPQGIYMKHAAHLTGALCLCAAIGAGAADSAPAAPDHFDSKFVQTRSLPGFNTPLVSHGVMRFDKQHGFYWGDHRSLPLRVPDERGCWPRRPCRTATCTQPLIRSRHPGSPHGAAHHRERPVRRRRFRPGALRPSHGHGHRPLARGERGGPSRPNRVPWEEAITSIQVTESTPGHPEGDRDPGDLRRSYGHPFQRRRCHAVKRAFISRCQMGHLVRIPGPALRHRLDSPGPRSPHQHRHPGDVAGGTRFVRARGGHGQQPRSAFMHQVLVLVSGDDVPATRDAALAAAQVLTKSGLSTDETGMAVGKVLAIYKTHHFDLLDTAQASRLAQGGADALAKDVAVSLASPAGLMSSFDTDPGSHLANFLSSLPRPYADFLPDGQFMSALRGDKRYFLLSMESQGSGFAAQGAMQVTNGVQDARAAVKRVCPGCTLQATGAPLFADAARGEAQAETLWLSAASMHCSSLVLIALVFRPTSHLAMLAALQLVASVLAACAAVILCFGSIQILTLVFGTTLLGIAIDYALLYFAEYWFGEKDPAKVMPAVRPGLYMGLLTGVAAFAFLLLAGFPALMQIAVFSIAGLLEAALVVVLIFPVTLTAPSKVEAHPTVDWPRRFISAACRPSRWRYLLPALALLLCIPGWLRLGTSDDVRDLQQVAAPELVQTDAQIRGTLGQIPPPGFFLATGRDLDQALTREEALFARLQGPLPDATPLGLSRFLPSVAEQRASLAAWDQVFQDPWHYAKPWNTWGSRRNWRTTCGRAGAELSARL